MLRFFREEKSIESFLKLAAKIGLIMKEMLKEQRALQILQNVEGKQMVLRVVQNMQGALNSCRISNDRTC